MGRKKVGPGRVGPSLATSSSNSDFLIQAQRRKQEVSMFFGYEMCSPGAKSPLDILNHNANKRYY